MAIIRPSEWRIEPQYYSRDYLEDLCARTVIEFCNDICG